MPGGQRWDSLRLFTPGRYNDLPGMPFPGSPSSYPAKDEDRRLSRGVCPCVRFPVRTGVKVDRLSKVGDRFEMICGKDTLFAENVVVATGASSKPRFPPFARELDERIVQLHSKEYATHRRIQEGGVLVVGAGNSGAEIAIELARAPPDVAIGPGHGQEPTGAAGSLLDRLLTPIMWFMATRCLTVNEARRKKGPRPLPRPAARTSSGPGATEGLCRCRHRTRAAHDRG